MKVDMSLVFSTGSLESGSTEEEEDVVLQPVMAVSERPGPVLGQQV